MPTTSVRFTLSMFLFIYRNDFPRWAGSWRKQWSNQYFHDKPGSIYNQTVCICHQLPAARRLGVCHVPQQTEQTLVWVVQWTSAEVRSGSALLWTGLDEPSGTSLSETHNYSILRNILVATVLRGVFAWEHFKFDYARFCTFTRL